MSGGRWLNKRRRRRRRRRRTNRQTDKARDGQIKNKSKTDS
jgi:hypothetical protein